MFMWNVLWPQLGPLSESLQNVVLEPRFQAPESRKNLLGLAEPGSQMGCSMRKLVGPLGALPTGRWALPATGRGGRPGGHPEAEGGTPGGAQREGPRRRAVLGLLLHITRARGREQRPPRRVSGGLVWGRDRVVTYNLSAPRGPLYSPVRAPHPRGSQLLAWWDGQVPTRNPGPTPIPTSEAVALGPTCPQLWVRAGLRAWLLSQLRYGAPARASCPPSSTPSLFCDPASMQERGGCLGPCG